MPKIEQGVLLFCMLKYNVLKKQTRRKRQVGAPLRLKKRKVSNMFKQIPNFHKNPKGHLIAEKNRHSLTDIIDNSNLVKIIRKSKYGGLFSQKVKRGNPLGSLNDFSEFKTV